MIFLSQFFFLEAEDLRIEPEVTVSNGKRLLKSLLKDFKTLPQKPKHSDIDGYAVVNVGPSVVPNPYLPSFRIYSYNTTGEEELSSTGEKKTKVMGRRHGHRRASDGNKVNCKSKEFANTWRCHLRRRWHSDPDSPSRRNQQWTPLGYSQVCYCLLDSQWDERAHYVILSIIFPALTVRRNHSCQSLNLNM